MTERRARLPSKEALSSSSRHHTYGHQGPREGRQPAKQAGIAGGKSVAQMAVHAANDTGPASAPGSDSNADNATAATVMAEAHLTIVFAEGT